MTGKLGKYTTILAVLVVAIVAIAAGLLATLLQASADRLDRQQLVFSFDGQIVFSYGAKVNGAPPIAAADEKRFQAIAKRLISEGRAGRLQAVTGVIEFAGEPQFVAMHPIAVASEKRKVLDLPNFVLVYMKTIDAMYLETVAEDFSLGGLAVPMSGWMDPLEGPGGLPPAYGLTWDSSPGGKQFISDSSGMLLTVAPVVAAMLIALAFGWVAVVNQARSVQAQVEAAEETSRAKSLFIANMSHEFRTPLNAVNGLSELIKNDTLDLGVPDKYKEYAGDIMASGQHLLRIVNNLLLFSKIEASSTSRASKPSVWPKKLHRLIACCACWRSSAACS
ncbi:MAG: histidine kinase dimerization/phospho-acceptor domain-containing protein [Micropepsaceae bacterium]